MSSSPLSLSEADQKKLIQVAYQSIQNAFTEHKPMPINLAQYTYPLTEMGASFVTLLKHNELRGCIGSLNPCIALVEDVSQHAFLAAFRDPRFPSLTQSEWPEIDIEVSVLSPLKQIDIANAAELIKILRPGIDGIYLEEDGIQATFLPSVWEKIPQAGEFIQHLKLKAGLPKNYWSEKMKWYLYTTQIIHAPANV